MLHNLNVLAHALVITLLIVYFSHNKVFSNSFIENVNSTTPSSVSNE